MKRGGDAKSPVERGRYLRLHTRSDFRNFPKVDLTLPRPITTPAGKKRPS